MDANPLVNAASPSSSDAGEKRTINLVSNAPPDRINGLEEFLAVFNAGEARAEIFHFRYIIQRRAILGRVVAMVLPFVRAFPGRLRGGSLWHFGETLSTLRLCP